MTKLANVRSTLLTIVVARNAKLKTELRNERFGSERSAISKIWRPKLRTWRRLPRLPIMRTRGFARKSIV